MPLKLICLMMPFVNMFHQTHQFHQVVTSYNLSFANLLQIVEITCTKPLDNKF